MAFPEALIHKEVDFQFYGEKLKFFLTQSLFSSFDIDSGSKLLLKTIAQQLDPSQWQSLIDLGCGIGVLGLSLKKKYPQLKLLGLDRNALAVAFSRMNARLNNLETDVTFEGSLGLRDLSACQADCLVSNVPAKAGAPVLEIFLSDLLRAHTEKGLAVIVIVKPLLDFIENTLRHMQAEILYKEETNEHAVLHFKRGSQTALNALPLTPGVAAGAVAHLPAGQELAVLTDLLKPYLRTKQEFRVPNQGTTLTYALETAYNLPDFDTLSYPLTLAMELMSHHPLQGRGLVWNPGQGHLPLYLLKSKGPVFRQLVLASRDKLQLETSRLNLLENDFPHESLVSAHLPYFTHVKSALASPADFVIFVPDDDPVQAWVNDANDLFLSSLITKGLLVLVTTSSVAFHLLQKLPGFILLDDKKFHGYRSLILKAKL